MKSLQGVGLALSGGGFRAMLFHLGVLWRLNEMGWLPKLNGISSVSGGALLAGRLSAVWPNLSFQSGDASSFKALVAEPILRFSELFIDCPAVVVGRMPFLSSARFASWRYRHLVGEKTLQDMPDLPWFIFNSCHFGSLSTWTFSKRRMGCWPLGFVDAPTVKIRDALAASAAFPPFLSPFTLKLDPRDLQSGQKPELATSRIDLTDGGVYDNLGLEAIWNRYETLLISDAGADTSMSKCRFRLWSRQVKRAIDITTQVSRQMQRRTYISRFAAGERRGTAWHIGSSIKAFPASPELEVDPDWGDLLSRVRTRLHPFTDQEQALLVNWGYVVSDVAMRSFLDTSASAALRLPLPESPLSRRALEEFRKRLGKRAA